MRSLEPQGNRMLAHGGPLPARVALPYLGWHRCTPSQPLPTAFDAGITFTYSFDKSSFASPKLRLSKKAQSLKSLLRFSGLQWPRHRPQHTSNNKRTSYVKKNQDPKSREPRRSEPGTQKPLHEATGPAAALTRADACEYETELLKRRLGPTEIWGFRAATLHPAGTPCHGSVPVVPLLYRVPHGAIGVRPGRRWAVCAMPPAPLRGLPVAQLRPRSRPTHWLIRAALMCLQVARPTHIAPGKWIGAGALTWTALCLHPPQHCSAACLNLHCAMNGPLQAWHHAPGDAWWPLPPL